MISQSAVALPPPSQDAFGQYNDACPHGDAGEMVIPKFDPSANALRLSSVLNLRDEGTPDVIARMLSERLVRMVNVRHPRGCPGPPAAGA